MLSEFQQQVAIDLHGAMPADANPQNEITLKLHEAAMNAWVASVNAVAKAFKRRDSSFDQTGFQMMSLGKRSERK